MSARPLTIALYSGRLTEGDAIANSLSSKQEVLSKWSAEGAPIRHVTFAYDADGTFPDALKVRNAVELVDARAFQEATLHVFEFGIYYGLFNAILMLPAGTAAGVAYHNLTPLELVDDPVVQHAIARSLEQRYNMLAASHVACVSELNLEDALSIGVAEDRASVVPLPSPVPITFAGPRSARTGPVRILFVGRPVRAKGVLDLIAAIRALAEEGLAFSADIIGRLDYADPQVVEEIRHLAADTRLAGKVRMLANQPAEAMPAAFEEADVLVMPSYHEGYCVPVVEALSAGCHVIAYDNSNLPSVTSGLAELVPTGDVAALVRSLRTFVQRLGEARAAGGPMRVPASGGELTEDRWRASAGAYAAGVPERFEGGLRRLFGALVDDVAAGRDRNTESLRAFKDYLCSAPYPS